MPSQADWIASLTPWPEEFGLDRMRELLAALGNPQRAYPSVHVVGTNGKSTAARTISALLRADGRCICTYTSPHVSGWHERLETDPAGFERAVARIRPDAERLGATQFEALTAAALLDFAERGVDGAVVEAGLGGRLDATNVLDARVVLLTNVGLEHTDVLGDTREAIAREKLAVAGPHATVVLGEPEWASLVPGNEVVAGGAREAAEAFLGRPVGEEVEVQLPGRLEWRSERELWDGAHNPDGVRWLAERVAGRRFAAIVASVLADKAVEEMAQGLSPLGEVLVATESSSPRALSADELGERAAPFFSRVERLADPAAARRHALELAGTEQAILVTGSLYLLADLAAGRTRTYDAEVPISG